MGRGGPEHTRSRPVSEKDVPADLRMFAVEGVNSTVEVSRLDRETGSGATADPGETCPDLSMLGVLSSRSARASVTMKLVTLVGGRVGFSMARPDLSRVNLPSVQVYCGQSAPKGAHLHVQRPTYGGGVYSSRPQGRVKITRGSTSRCRALSIDGRRLRFKG